MIDREVKDAVGLSDEELEDFRSPDTEDTAKLHDGNVTYEFETQAYKCPDCKQRVDREKWDNHDCGGDS